MEGKGFFRAATATSRWNPSPVVAFPPKGHPDSACTTPGAESPPSREEARRVSEPAELHGLLGDRLHSYSLQLPDLHLTARTMAPTTDTFQF